MRPATDLAVVLAADRWARERGPRSGRPGGDEHGMTQALLTSVLAFLVAIGVLVAVHEYGHFWVARQLGFKVLRFSIGFGRALWSRTGAAPDRTEYVIAAIPLGGYVKMLDEREGPVAPRTSRAPSSRTPLAPHPRAAGRSVVQFPVCRRSPSGSCSCTACRRSSRWSAKSPWTRSRRNAGLRPETPSRRSVDATSRRARERCSASSTSWSRRGAMPLGVTRSGRARAQPGARGADRGAPWPDRAGRAADGARLRVLVPASARRSSARWRKAGRPPGGLVPGDEIVGLDGIEVPDFPALVAMVRERPGRASCSTSVSNGGERRLRVDVQAEAEGDATVGRIGMGSTGRMSFPDSMRTMERHGPLAAIAPALGKTWEMTVLTVKILWSMVTGDVSLKNSQRADQHRASTPVCRAQGGLTFPRLPGDRERLPLRAEPAADPDPRRRADRLPAGRGGEGQPAVGAERRRSASRVGIAFLVVLMSFAFYNDLSRLFSSRAGGTIASCFAGSSARLLAQCRRRVLPGRERVHRRRHPDRRPAAHHRRHGLQLPAGQHRRPARRSAAARGAARAVRNRVLPRRRAAPRRQHAGRGGARAPVDRELRDHGQQGHQDRGPRASRCATWAWRRARPSTARCSRK